MSQEWSQPIITPIRHFFAQTFLSQPYMIYIDYSTIYIVLKSNIGHKTCLIQLCCKPIHFNPVNMCCPYICDVMWFPIFSKHATYKIITFLALYNLQVTYTQRYYPTPNPSEMVFYVSAVITCGIL